MGILARTVEVWHIDSLVADIACRAVVHKLFTDVEFAIDLHLAVCVEH